MVKILFGAAHTGGANALSPVINSIIASNDYRNITVLAQELTSDIFTKQKIESTTPNIELEHLSDIAKKYDLVVTGQSIQNANSRETLDQNLILISKFLGIPTISVSDFWTGRLAYFNDNRLPDGNFRFLPDIITTIDDYQTDIMVEEGFSKDILVKTGNPYFDDLPNLQKEFSKRQKRNALSYFGLSSRLPIVTFASQPIELYYGKDSSNPKFLGYTEKTSLENLVKALESLPIDTQLIIRPHPEEKKEQNKFDKILRDYSGTYVIDDSYDLHNTILASDVLVTPFSTVAVQAALMNKPVLSLQPNLIGQDPLITNNLGITKPIYDTSKLYAAIIDSFYYKPKGQLVTYNSGLATQNVVNLIKKQLNK